MMKTGVLHMVVSFFKYGTTEHLLLVSYLNLYNIYLD